MQLQPSPPACIKLQISDACEYYVGGDTVCGEVILAVVDAQYCVRSVRVELVCTEEVDLSPRGSREVLVHYKHADTLVQNERLGPGWYRYEYVANVPDTRGRYPPSLCVKGSRNCGIRWHVRASADAEATDGQLRTVEDTATVQVFPLPAHIEGRGAIGRTFNKQTVDDQKCSVCNLVCIPQGDEVCGIEVTVELSEPAYVCSVDVYIVFCVVVWLGPVAEVFEWREALETVRVEKVVTKVALDGASRGRRLQGPVPPTFSSVSMHLRYDLCVEVNCAEKEPISFTWLHMKVAFPSAAASGAARDDPPPEYSEDALQKGGGPHGKVDI